MTEVVSTPLAQGESGPSFITFRQQISDAIARAPYTHDFETANEQSAAAAMAVERDYSLVDHEEVIGRDYRRQPHEVITNDPDYYRVLLAEAYIALDATDQALGGVEEPDVPSLAEVMESEEYKEDYEHEMDHAQAGLHFSGGRLLINYGVEFGFRKNEGGLILGMRPFVAPQGSLKRIHWAWLMLAPKQPSTTDIRLAAALGYGAGDKEYIAALAESIAPLGRVPRPRSSLRSPASALAEALLTQWDIRRRGQG